MMLWGPASSWELEVDAELRKQFGKQLWVRKSDDRLRLLKLRVWSLRYHVPLQYILAVLVPHFEKLASRQYIRKRAGSSKGLGFPITVLCGDVAHEFLQERIAKDFPSKENTQTWIEGHKQLCLEKTEMDEVVAKPRAVLAYRSVGDFVKSYGRGIDRTRRDADRAERKLRKQPWRTNPFLQ